jgi:hypothetical protein
MLSLRQGLTVIALGATVLSLQACASDATFLGPDGATPDTQHLQADASDCREIGPLLAGFFGGAAWGAAEGALVGAGSGGAGPGAIIGAGVGGLVGVFAGAVTSAGGAGYERCMAGKGYRRG